MIITENYRLEFYDHIKEQHVLLATGMDVDAICSAQILMQLMEAEDISYTLLPVTDYESLVESLALYSTRAQSVVFVNCGANRSLQEYLAPGQTFYVIDSRRPFNLNNVYADDRIRLLLTPEEIQHLNIPDELFFAASSDESEESETKAQSSGQASTVEEEDGEDEHSRTEAVEHEESSGEAEEGELLTGTEHECDNEEVLVQRGNRNDISKHESDDDEVEAQSGNESDISERESDDEEIGVQSGNESGTSKHASDDEVEAQHGEESDTSNHESGYEEIGVQSGNEGDTSKHESDDEEVEAQRGEESDTSRVHSETTDQSLRTVDLQAEVEAQRANESDTSKVEFQITDQSPRAVDSQASQRTSSSDPRAGDKPTASVSQKSVASHVDTSVGKKGSSLRKRGRDIAEDIAMREQLRRAKQLRAEKRDDLLWDYYEKTWHAVPSAVIALKLAHSVGRAAVEMVWSALIAAGSQLNEFLILRDSYTASCFNYLRAFIRKFVREETPNSKGDDILHIYKKTAALLPIPYYWSLKDSMTHSDYYICKGKLWQQNSEESLKKIFVELQVSIEEANRHFSSLQTARREKILEQVLFQMNDGIETFVGQIGYGGRYNTFDFARALASRIGDVKGRSETSGQRFTGALEILNRFLDASGDNDPVREAIEVYKTQMKRLVQLVMYCLNGGCIKNRNLFYYVCIPQEQDCKVLLSRHFLLIFANYVNSGYHAMTRKGRCPMFVLVPVTEPDGLWYLVTGVMPATTLYDDLNQKSIISRALERSLSTMKYGTKSDFFDEDIVMIREDQKTRFLGALGDTLEGC